MSVTPAAATVRLAGGELLVLGGVDSAVLLGVAARYGPHRDELYFLRAGAEPTWGYADQPPLTPLLAHALDVVFGGSLVGLRAPSALVAGLVVVLTGLIARELGAGRGAQLLAAVLWPFRRSCLWSGICCRPRRSICWCGRRCPG